MTPSVRVELVLIQKCIEKSAAPKLPALAPKFTTPLTPSNAAAFPTLPAVNVTPPLGVPGFVPAMSFIVPSAGHQSTVPAAGGRHCLHIPLPPAPKTAAISLAVKARRGGAHPSTPPPKDSPLKGGLAWPVTKSAPGAIGPQKPVARRATRA